MIEKAKKKKKLPDKPEWYTTGRITIKTDEVVSKLIEILRIDWTIWEACSYANINRTTYYRWLQEDEDFKNKMEDAQEYCFIEARKMINQCIKTWNWNLAMDLMKRRDKRYRDKIESEVINYNKDVTELSDDELNKLLLT